MFKFTRFASPTPVVLANGATVVAISVLSVDNFLGHPGGLFNVAVVTPGLRRVWWSEVPAPV